VLVWLLDHAVVKLDARTGAHFRRPRQRGVVRILKVAASSERDRRARFHGWITAVVV
jgi:hypothetical protein